jgi:hypothetical protein
MQKIMILEGIDGTGKSHVASHLDIELEAPVHHFPTRLPGLENRRDNLDRVLFHLRDFHEHARQGRSEMRPRFFDRSYLSTLVYQGFQGQHSLLKDPVFYNAIFSLGAEAFFGDSRLGGPARGVPRMEAVFCLFRCDVNEANRRIQKRKEEVSCEEWDSVDKLGVTSRLSLLRHLSMRYDIIYHDLISRLPLLYPDVDFRFTRPDVSQLSMEDTIQTCTDLYVELETGDPQYTLETAHLR